MYHIIPRIGRVTTTVRTPPLTASETTRTLPASRVPAQCFPSDGTATMIQTIMTITMYMLLLLLLLLLLLIIITIIAMVIVSILVTPPRRRSPASAPGRPRRSPRGRRARRPCLDSTNTETSNETTTKQNKRGFHEYCQRALFRHPSIRRIAEQLATKQTTSEEQGIRLDQRIKPHR